MKFEVVENFRDVDGNHRDPWCLCSYCGGLSEIYVKTMMNDYEKTYLIACKGCLSDMIQSIDNKYVESMKKDATIVQR
jgi:hypothetical protein